MDEVYMSQSNIRIINGPLPHIMKMILRRLPTEVHHELENRTFNSIALINANIPSIYYFADIAQKAAPVYSVEMSGTCPQHIMTLVLFGDVSAVQTAVKVIESEI